MNKPGWEKDPRQVACASRQFHHSTSLIDHGILLLMPTKASRVHARTEKSCEETRTSSSRAVSLLAAQ